MYGVPPNLPLQRFVGSTCDQICIGAYEIQFKFSQAGTISCQSKWELRDTSGAVVDQDLTLAERDCYRVHKILDTPVTRFVIDAPRSFPLYFENGYALTIFDDSEQFESFSIEPGNIFV